jgi:DNA modification methylase
MFSYPDDYVLDPFAGSFTSVITAKKLGRVGIGIELNKAMFGESSMNNLINSLQAGLFEQNEIEIAEINLL